MATHCKRCGGRLNRGTKTSYHIKCEPLICECDEPSAGPNGECNTCHRLIVKNEIPNLFDTVNIKVLSDEDIRDLMNRDDLQLREVTTTDGTMFFSHDVATNHMYIYGFIPNKEDVPVPDYPDWVQREDIPLIEEKVEIVSRVGCMPIDVAKQNYLNYLIVYGYPGNKEALSGSGIDASSGGSAEQTK